LISHSFSTFRYAYQIVLLDVCRIV
jgi:hypothetical protein